MVMAKNLTWKNAEKNENSHWDKEEKKLYCFMKMRISQSWHVLGRMVQLITVFFFFFWWLWWIKDDSDSRPNSVVCCASIPFVWLKNKTHAREPPQFRRLGMKCWSHFKFLTRFLCMHKSLLRECLQMSICWLAASLFCLSIILFHRHMPLIWFKTRHTHTHTTQIPLRMFYAFRWYIWFV